MVWSSADLPIAFPFDTVVDQCHLIGQGLWLAEGFHFDQCFASRSEFVDARDVIEGHSGPFDHGHACVVTTGHGIDLTWLTGLGCAEW